MRRWVVALMALLVGGSSAVQAQDNPVEVPFVGCPSDGQQGPLEPPGSGKAPSLPRAAADRLAWYKGNDLGVLAPRGWNCIELYGSSGSALLVTPERHDADGLFGSPGFDGPFVIVSVAFGSTSGRFTVASIAGPLFPVAAPFVNDVLNEPDTDTKLVSVANDELTRRSDTMVDFVTPPHKDGLGTDGWVRKSALPVYGTAILLPDEDMDLLMVRARLPVAMVALAPIIIAQRAGVASDCRCSNDE